MTIPDEIIEAVAMQRFRITADQMSEKAMFRDDALDCLNVVIQALTTHGYKITGPEVTEAMYGAYWDSNPWRLVDEREARVAAGNWRAMHTAAPPTPWEEG